MFWSHHCYHVDVSKDSKNISWTERLTNVPWRVMRRKGKIVNSCRNKEEKTQIKVDKTKSFNWSSREKIHGKRSVRRRRRISWQQNLRECFSILSADLFKAAISKVRIAIMIAIFDRRRQPKKKTAFSQPNVQSWILRWVVTLVTQSNCP